MSRGKLAVIGVGNMAKAIIGGVIGSKMGISHIYLFDVNRSQCEPLNSEKISVVSSIEAAIAQSDSVLISVKPQNYSEVLETLSSLPSYREKLYISIGAGISTEFVKSTLGDVSVVRVLPNVPMLIGSGVSVICRNEAVLKNDFDFVKQLFLSAGSVIEIDESEMNRIIGVTSSSPAYVFKFIDAIYKGALEQGIDSDDLLDAICDMVIGSALMLKNGNDSPSQLINKVASKGGTTERALAKLDEYSFTEGVIDAMKACTARADELGAKK